ncbi:HTH-type transcriptional regulator Ptr1 [Arthrobacter ginkgonis]|uniref:HTH-type transcriptional regulator Ptr1 n=1 Tax=Arthrobacter ginkgonis TaxID=1630594 RepID=A0ABP7C5H8_9MICC
MAKYQMDDLDRAILQSLEDDGRKAMREIARELGTAEATVRARIKRLQESNVLRIVAFVDPDSVGGTQLSLVFVAVEPARHQSVVDALVDLPEVTYVSTLLGAPDICIEVQCGGNAELWAFVNGKVSAIPGVVSAEPRPILRVHKLRYGAATS